MGVWEPFGLKILEMRRSRGIVKKADACQQVKTVLQEYIMKITIEQAKKSNESEPVYLSIEDYQALEFKCLKCFSRHNSLKLINGFLFNKLFERNLIGEQDIYADIGLIRSVTNYVNADI